MGKRALVVSGGGCKGAFAVGAIEYIIKQKAMDFDMVLGTSTGSLIAPLVVTGEIDELHRIYTTVKTEEIFIPRRFSEIIATGSAFSARPLLSFIEKSITGSRWQTINASPKQIFLATVCMQTGQTTYFYTGPQIQTEPGTMAIKIQNREELIYAMLASACVPIFGPLVPVPKDGNLQYCDGGVRELAPITISILNGAEEVYVILLSPEHQNGYPTKYNDLISILKRTISLLSDEVGKGDVNYAKAISDGSQYVQAIKKQLIDDKKYSQAQVDSIFVKPGGVKNPFENINVKNLVVIRPAEELIENSDEFDPVKMSAMVAFGKQQAQIVLG